jgi:4-azaleucine resistance transporter AzlC
LLCDETFSIVSCVEPPVGVERTWFYACISFLHYLYWVTGTFLGGMLGNFIKFSTEGLDFVLTALFVVLFMEQMKQPENRAFGLIGIVGTVIGLFVFGADNVVLPSMAIILTALLAGRKRLWN